MCAFGVESLAACERVDAADTQQARRLRNQCVQLRQAASHRGDFAEWLKSSPPVFPSRARDDVRAQLRATAWPEPPAIVLMPVPRAWTDQVLARGEHDWALSILQPLVDEGHIRVIDGTDFFNGDADAGCSAFFDFYHQNAAGRERFTRWLLPQLEGALYASRTAAR